MGGGSGGAQPREFGAGRCRRSLLVARALRATRATFAGAYMRCEAGRQRSNGPPAWADGGREAAGSGPGRPSSSCWKATPGLWHAPGPARDPTAPVRDRSDVAWPPGAPARPSGGRLQRCEQALQTHLKRVLVTDVAEAAGRAGGHKGGCVVVEGRHLAGWGGCEQEAGWRYVHVDALGGFRGSG